MQCSCEEIRTIVREILEEYVSEIIAACSVRTKRKPSAYNQFMGECVRSKPKDIPIQERFRQCAVEYKSRKT